MRYKIKQAEFIAASNTYQGLPKSKGPEVCLLGRSNVGKSSLINALVARKSLARVGKTPGVTKNICMYSIKYQETRANAGKEKSGMLCDLPGYGYAKTSQENKKLWSDLICSYLAEREALVKVVLLVDIRRDLGFEEEQVLTMSNKDGLLLALTKSDKCTLNELNKRIEYFSKVSSLSKESIFTVSTQDSKFKKSLDDLRDHICISY